MKGAKMHVISFEKGSFIERIKYRFWPSYRRKVDAKTRETIKWLVAHPEAPCMIGEHYIPNGYGGKTLDTLMLF